jgi:hypothetical protein
MQNLNWSISNKLMRLNLYLNSLQSLDPSLHSTSELRYCGLTNVVR